MDDDRDSDEEVLDGFMMLLGLHILQKPNIVRQPQRISSLTGYMYTLDLMAGPPQTIIDILRMDADTFRGLVRLLKESPGLLNWGKMRLTVEESLAIFLYVVAHKGGEHRTVTDRFQHSTETTSRHFKIIMRALCNLAPTLITPRSTDVVPRRIMQPQFYPWFKDCIGAIDGTLVDASPPVARQNPYRGRKNGLSQNVLAACDFNMLFTFVHAGWEGSAHDSRVLGDAAMRPELGFPNPPPGKYYLVDGGYTNMRGFLAPYKKHRAHVAQFQNTEPISGPEELFNKRLSSLRSVVECTFGVLKKRFSVLKMMPAYKTARQGLVVIACCVVHNWIRIMGHPDELFDEVDNQFPIWEPEDLRRNVADFSEQSVADMGEFRRAMTISM